MNLNAFNQARTLGLNCKISSRQENKPCFNDIYQVNKSSKAADCFPVIGKQSVRISPPHFWVSLKTKKPTKHGGFFVG
jgi:hypothetical protein